MITLSLSEAYCYDMLAIAGTKAFRTDSDAAWQEYWRLVDQIAEQVGDAKHLDVVFSSEYAALIQVNDEMYIRIDELKQRPVTAEDALYIDDRVYARFKAKQALQARWFPDQPLTEQKFGYKEGGQ